jgi:hypothetical protein
VRGGYGYGRRDRPLLNAAVGLGLAALVIHTAAHHGGHAGARAAASLPGAPQPAAHHAGAVTGAGPVVGGHIHWITTQPWKPNAALAARLAAAAGVSPHDIAYCLLPLWQYESASTWSPTVTNPSSGAYGIPQALPGSKMAAAGADWQTNPATQVRWGLDYLKSRYGGACEAFAFERAHNAY